MEEQLQKEDLDFILESLKYTKLRFEEYQDYPSYEFKQKRLQEAESVIAKVRKLKRDWVE